jgi:hypothetical protein
MLTRPTPVHTKQHVRYIDTNVQSPSASGTSNCHLQGTCTELRLQSHMSLRFPAIPTGAVRPNVFHEILSDLTRF